MRLVTFNILNGRHPADDHVDPALLDRAVRDLAPDVLALQEVDRNQPRSAQADLTAVAGEAMGAVAQRFVAALHGVPGSAWVAATGEAQPDTAEYGVALLSRWPVTHWQVVRLPALRRAAPMWFRRDRRPTLVRDEPRVAVAATVATPDGPLTVATTHLTFVPWWNGVQLTHLVGALDADRDQGVARGRDATPLVLTGDLNMGPPRAQGLTGMRSLAAHPTFPAHAPRAQLDHVLGRGAVRAVGSEAPAAPLSDHRPLVVELALG
ncbi:endonuclease/exonuclease/phosphatase family protein [Nocardioides perillae]|uniref:Endonuclease/exonuclease/phosphatase family metal-dependent hydrolase n=1 Tax=Nocardioides perillae TaxID=1119534 RepID=A0A7Y9RX36_9ACTN|nr:endonuclease/exonuclease/phosphatase family protein [Nocardioides perillae]NYG56267.1 endonuclease/exonuclease/phosphatase family metal-dependent hydrolase [Nocardioides perillae]